MKWELNFFNEMKINFFFFQSSNILGSPLDLKKALLFLHGFVSQGCVDNLRFLLSFPVVNAVLCCSFPPVGLSLC